MFHIKICGVTTPADARLAADAGADAIGLNFVAGSPRHVTPDAASAIAAAIPPGVLKVGVFVGTPGAAIRDIVSRVGLDAVQLHGQWPADTAAAADPPELCAALAGIPVIRAVRLGSGTGPAPLDEARRWVSAAFAMGHGPALVLVDASPPVGAGPGAYGGSGRTVDWRALGNAGAMAVPIGVAGGLRPDNVGLAVAQSGAVAVDTASGVESAPGRKDAVAVRMFVAAAKAAFSRPSR